MLHTKRTILVALTAMALIPFGSAMAAPEEYRFELVAKPTKAGGASVIRVRLTHQPDRKPVSGAILIQPKLEMGEGAGAMGAPLKVGTATEAGVYAFEAKPSMDGEWVLTFGAKVPGEAATVRARIVLDLAQ